MTMFRISNLDHQSNKQFDFKNFEYDQDLINFIRPIQDDYPCVLDWYLNNVQTERYENTRKIITYMSNDKIIALGIAKKDMLERKICTLRVDQNYWGRGLGSKLIEDLTDWLGESTPLITVSEQKYHCFETLFKKFDFKTTSIKEGLYKPGVHEIILNEKQSSLD